MALYNKETTDLLDRNNNMHTFCVELQYSLSKWVSEPIDDSKGLKKYIAFSNSNDQKSNEQRILEIEKGIATDLEGTKLGSLFGILSSAQQEICFSEAIANDETKQDLLGSVNHFLNEVWPPIGTELKKLEVLRIKYERALDKLAKSPFSDKKNSVAKSVLATREAFVAKLTELVPLLQKITETEDALIKNVLEMSITVGKHYSNCRKHFAAAFAKIMDKDL